jgi:hypothetical protein
MEEAGRPPNRPPGTGEIDGRHQAYQNRSRWPEDAARRSLCTIPNVAKSEPSKPLLAEELAMRESRRVKMAVQVAKLSAMKTFPGFDFTFQPSLDTCPGAPRIAVH